jgi:hypothetical protein
MGVPQTDCMPAQNVLLLPVPIGPSRVGIPGPPATTITRIRAGCGSDYQTGSIGVVSE